MDSNVILVVRYSGTACKVQYGILCVYVYDTSTKNHVAVANLEDTAPETTSNAFGGSQLAANFARPQPTSQSPVEQTAQGSATATATADLLLKTFGIEQQILQPGCTLHLSMADAYGQMFPLSEFKV